MRLFGGLTAAFSASPQFCASSQKEAEEWVEQIDFVLKGVHSPPFDYSSWPVECSDLGVSVADALPSGWTNEPQLTLAMVCLSVNACVCIPVCVCLSVCVCAPMCPYVCAHVCRNDRDHPPG